MPIAVVFTVVTLALSLCKINKRGGGNICLFVQFTSPEISGKIIMYF